MLRTATSRQVELQGMQQMLCANHEADLVLMLHAPLDHGHRCSTDSNLSHVVLTRWQLVKENLSFDRGQRCKHKISCLQRMQLTCNTHGHPNICCCQGRCIIDAVTNVQNWTIPLAILRYLWNVPHIMFATAAVY